MAIIDTRTSGVLSVIHAEGEDDPIDALRAFVASATGLPLQMVRRRWLQKVGTRPPIETDWASVGVTNVETKGTQTLSDHKGDLPIATSGYSRTESHQRLTVSAMFYGSHASTLADRFRDACGFLQNAETLHRYGLTIQGVDENITQIPDFVFEQWCNRFEVKFFIGRKVVREYGVRDIAIAPDVSIFTDKGELTNGS